MANLFEEDTEGALFNSNDFNTPEETSGDKPVVCLGMTFANDDERREYFRNELRKKLPELRQIEGFPIGEEEDIINLSDPPYHTACPNPWLNDFIAEWEQEKIELEKQGKRTADFQVNEPYAYGIKVGKNSAIYNAHTYHTKVPYQVIMRYILHYTQPGDVVLDGFAGTGMTGVAASACGYPDYETKKSIIDDFSNNGLQSPKWGARHAVCGDLSPLCFHISSNYNSKPNLSKLNKAVKEIIKKLKDKFGYLYEYDSPHGKGHINYFVWSEIVSCKNCGHELNVHDLSFNYESNTLYKELVCPNCGTSQKKNDASQVLETTFDEITNSVTEQIKYECCLFNFSIPKKGRFFSSVITNQELTHIEGFIPINIIPSEGDEIPRLHKLGCDTINKIYHPRIQLILAYLYQLINTSHKECKAELMFIFTSMLPKLTRMNRYMPQHGSRALVGPMANTLYIPPQCVENNPIDQFEYQAGKVIRAFEFCFSGSVVQTCSATNTSIADNSVDYIFTDPPFGANIMYSELNTVSESWLKVMTNNKEEAISNKSQRKGLVEYQDIMTQCFKEYFRVLKPNKWMTVEFSNTSAAFWNSLQYSIKSAGFIITCITDLNKERGGLHSMLGPTAVKQDLAISCYKPSDNISIKFNNDTSNNIWEIVEDHLLHLSSCVIKDNECQFIIERDARIIYDRIISHYIQKGFNIPMSSIEFQVGLRERFIERDGMFFTAQQVAEYDEKKRTCTGVQRLALIVSCEQDGIQWLKNELERSWQTYSDLQPKWMQALNGTRKGDIIPELRDLLNENFIEESDGRWRTPNAQDDVDMEKLRMKALLREWKIYVEAAQKPRTKLKEVRVEALRAGFHQCWKDKDFATIILVGDKIPQNLLTEDEKLLLFYDMASSKI